MTSRRIARAGHLAALTLVAASGLLAGCGDEPVATPVVHDIGEPWQATPFAVAEDVLARIEAACRQGDMVPATVPIAVMDVRGAGVGVVILADPRNQGECLVVPGDAPGTFAMSVAGAATGVGLNLPVGRLTIANESIGTAQLGPLDGRAITFVHGQVGADVGLVEIVLPSGSVCRQATGAAAGSRRGGQGSSRHSAGTSTTAMVSSSARPDRLDLDLAAMAAQIPPTRHVTTTRIVAVRGSELEYRADRVVGEEPLEIRAAGPGQKPVAVAVTMRTPGFEDELAAGFLRTEGLIDGPEILRFQHGDPAVMSQPDDQVTVHLARPFDATRVAERHFAATASCGICGKASLDEVEVRAAAIPDGPIVSRTVLLALPDLLRAAQRAFDETGGLHAAGLFTPGGELIALREDVGRHNALDKIVGSQVLERAMPLHDRLLVVSGRVSFEIIQKAAVAGIPIVAAVSAPSDLAVEAADRLGVTLVGFLRGDGFNVYAHDERVDLRDLLGVG